MKYICLGYFEKSKHEGMTEGAKTDVRNML